MRRLGFLLLLVSLGCAGGGTAAKSAAAVSAGSRAPYDSPPEAAATIAIPIDARAARQILESLARPHLDPADAKVLQDLPAVADAIRDSTRGSEVFERDFAAAFQAETQAAVFDFKSVRDHKDRWQPVLDGVLSRQADLVRLSQQRAASLLPADAAVSVRLEVDLTFALAGLEDDLVVRTPEGAELMIIDFGRALSDSDGSTLDAHLSRLSRLIAGEACRLSWNAYRGSSPAWKRAIPNWASSSRS